MPSAQTTREDFLAQRPEVPNRLAELDRAIEHEQELGASAKLGTARPA